MEGLSQPASGMGADPGGRPWGRRVGCYPYLPYPRRVLGLSPLDTPLPYGSTDDGHRPRFVAPPSP
jgi:hypothetical protein